MSLIPIFAQRVPQVWDALETSTSGLTAAEVETRLSLYGPNVLTRQKKQSNLAKFLQGFLRPLAVALLVVGLAALLHRDALLALIIWTIVLVNAAFAFWREYRAGQAIDKLRQMLPSFAHVIRGGIEVYVPASEVVPGDLLVLAEGDNIPADARVVEEYGLRTNNATLTGEAVPARKTADPSTQEGVSELDRPNLIFAGTSVASGTGRAVVSATGMSTQFGRIARLTQAIEEEPTPFQKELNALSKWTVWIAALAGGTVAAIGYFELGFPLREISLLALGIAVAIIPEGMMATLTLSLAAAVQRLAEEGVLAKKLATVEKLGLVSVICTDKSGTLTQNQMTVRDVWVSGRRLKLSGVGYEPRGDFQPDPRGQPWEQDLCSLLEAAFACNNARINPPSQEHVTWTSLGDQTEAALKVAAMKGGITDQDLSARLPRVHELPFDARRKRMTTIHRGAFGEVAFVKGAPREVLQNCTHVLVDGQLIPLSPALRSEILAANDDYARRALRVLALARRDLPPRSGAFTSERVEQELTFLGLMAMMDPPRPEVEAAVRACRAAHIRFVMITGDYGLTAESLARRVGMLETAKPIILTGAELDELSEVALQEMLSKEVLFARMAPEHKLRLVAAFQERGEVVAVTGDGVNDAPALRKADVGVSMGVSGTDVAREAADIILAQDDFGAIAAAIQEGRAVYDNIRKFITYIFSSNIPELAPFLLKASIPLLPLALGVRQILAIDLGTDLFPALALGMEKPEPDLMKRPPRPRNQPLLDRGLLWRAFWLGMIEASVCLAGFLAVFILSGHAAHIGLPFLGGLRDRLGLPQVPLSFGQATILAATIYYAGLVMAQVGNALACRSERTRPGWLSNGYLWAAIAIELVGVVSTVEIPAVAHLFRHTPLPLWVWLSLALYAPVLYSLEWGRKLLARSIHRAREASALNPQEVQE